MAATLLEKKADVIKHKDFCVDELYENQLETVSKERQKSSRIAKIEVLELQIDALTKVRLDAFEHVMFFINDMAAAFLKENLDVIKHKDFCIDELNIIQLEIERKERQISDQFAKIGVLCFIFLHAILVVAEAFGLRLVFSGHFQSWVLFVVILCFKSHTANCIGAEAIDHPNSVPDYVRIANGMDNVKTLKNCILVYAHSYFVYICLLSARLKSKTNFCMRSPTSNSVAFTSIAKSRCLSLFVLSDAVDSFVLSVFSDEYVADVKARICNRTCLSPAHIRLVFDGKLLDDTRKISECNVKCGSSFYLFLRMRGGSGLSSRAILDDCHSQALNLLSSAAAGYVDKPIEGISQGIRIVKHKLDSKLIRKLREIEITCNYNRHATAEKSDRIIKQLSVSLSASGVTCSLSSCALVDKTAGVLSEIKEMRASLVKDRRDVADIRAALNESLSASEKALANLVAKEEATVEAKKVVERDAAKLVEVQQQLQQHLKSVETLVRAHSCPETSSEPREGANVQQPVSSAADKAPATSCPRTSSEPCEGATEPC